MMNLSEWLKQRWQAPATHYTYFWIDPTHVALRDGDSLNRQPLKAGHHYFRIWLAEMFLQNDRQWGTAWYPALLSAVRFQFGSDKQQVSHIAGETTLKDFNLKDLTRSVARNHQITALVPFNGGSIELEAALLAMPGKSDLQSLLKVLGTFSKLLVVPQLSTALSVVTPLAEGIAELIGASGAQPELRLQDTWTGVDSGGTNLLRAGYFVVMSTAGGTHKPEQCWVKQDQLCYGASLAASQPVTGCHYMLFRIDTTEVRDDWDTLTSIREPYEQAVEMLQQSLNAEPELQKKMLAEAEKRLAAAKLAAFRSKELTKIVGRNQVIDALQKGFDEAKKQLGAGAFKEDLPTSLSAALRRAISPAEAAAHGEMQEDELWLS